MEWKSAEGRAEGAVKIPERWLHLYYYEALTILFRFENALRLFVYVVLKKNLGKDWDLTSVGDGITIRTETRKRIAQTREHGYLGYDVSSPMLFLNSGELTQIICSDAYWKHFAPFFRAPKAIVLSKLQEIGTVRNSLAHFRPLKQDDIDLIKQNSRHLLMEVEACLVQLTSIANIVPSNSQMTWYREIKPIGNEQFSTALFASPDQSWVRLQLEYKLPVLQKTVYSEQYIQYSVGNFRTSQLLILHPALREACILLSESPMYGRVSKDFMPEAAKQVSLVFAQEALVSNIGSVAAAIKGVALTVQSETELLTQDNLARGELVEPRSISATLKDGHSNQKYWSLNVDSLNTSPQEIECVEYWGQRWNYPIDFISSVHHYPWMPSSVSAQELPF
jgi:hypothetical protein